MTLAKITVPSKKTGPVTSSTTTVAAMCNDSTSFDRSNIMQNEQCRRSSMASSTGDSLDYQNQQADPFLMSPVHRRASGPSNKPQVDLKERTTLPRLEREDSWGNMSIEELL